MNRIETAFTRDPDSVPITEWRDPESLSVKAYPPEPYPLDAFPVGICAALNDVHQLTQAPMAMIGTSALMALSLVGQGHVDVARNSHLRGPVSLFGLTVADSGERKTSVDSSLIDAVRKYEFEQESASELRKRQYAAQMAAWNSKKTGLQEAIKQKARKGENSDDSERELEHLLEEEPLEPKIPRQMYTDATPEALAFGLANEWPSAGVVSSEGGAVFGSHGMSHDSVMRNLSMLNILWDGGEFRVARRTMENYVLRGARLTLSLQVQQPVLTNFIQKTGDLARGSGFFARFLIAWPESTQGFRLYREPPEDPVGLQEFQARLIQILEEPLSFDTSGNGLEPKLLQFSASAKEKWVEFHDVIEQRLAPLGDLMDVRDVASKAADNAARIAALFHVFLYGTKGEISTDETQGACTLALWHLGEAQRLLTELSQDPSTNVLARLDVWLIAKCKELQTNKLSTTQVLQLSHVRQAKQLEDLVGQLAVVHRAALVAEGKRKWVVVNPKLLSAGDV